MCADKYFFSGIFLCRNVIENRLDLKSGQVILGAKDDQHVSHFHIYVYKHLDTFVNIKKPWRLNEW